MLLARLPRMLTSTTSSSLPSSYQLLRCPALSPLSTPLSGAPPLHPTVRQKDSGTAGSDPRLALPARGTAQTGRQPTGNQQWQWAVSLSILLNKSIKSDYHC